MAEKDLEKALPRPPSSSGSSTYSIPAPPNNVSISALAAAKEFTIATTIVVNATASVSNSNPTPVSNGVTTPAFFATFNEKFNEKFPKGNPVLGLKRSTFFMALAAFVYILLAGIVALGVGLGGGSRSSPSGLTQSHELPPPITGSPDNLDIDLKDTTDLPLPDPATSGNAIYTGEMTYYNPALGSCGIESTDNDPIVAISHFYYDANSVGSNPNLNPLCGKKVRATRYRAELGKNITVEATIVDRCTGCQPYDLDFSPYLFKKLAAEELGRTDVTWTWI